MGNGKKDDLKDPVIKCAKVPGSLLAEVTGYRALFPKSKREAIPGVTVRISGTTAKPDQHTAAKGRTQVVSGLEPGAYKVAIELPDAMKEKYDVAHATTSDTREVKKNKTTVYPFEVPWFWVELQVQYPDLKTFVSGIEYVLRHQKPGAPQKAWAQLSTGTTGLKKVTKDKVPAGRYKLDLKLVYEPSWGEPKVEIDKVIELRATVSGFDPGTNGTFQIYDAHTSAPVLHTIKATVAYNADNTKRELKASWIPAKADLKDLKGSTIVFRAAVGNLFVFSAPEPVFVKETYDVVDDDGNKLATKIELRFSGGHTETRAVAGGALDVLVPWNEKIARIGLPEHKGKYVVLDDGDVPDRRCLMPS